MTGLPTSQPRRRSLLDAFDADCRPGLTVMARHEPEFAELVRDGRMNPLSLVHDDDLVRKTVGTAFLNRKAGVVQRLASGLGDSSSAELEQINSDAWAMQETEKRLHALGIRQTQFFAF